MFPFGSIASEFTLFVLALAYMMYFGMYALNKTKTDASADIIQDKEQYVKSSSCESAGNTFYFKHFPNNKQAICSNKREIDVFQEHFNSSVKYLPDTIISSHLHQFSLFSRPPPSIT